MLLPSVATVACCTYMFSYDVAMLLPCCCHAVAMLLLCHFYAVAMLLPCCCCAVAMLLLIMLSLCTVGNEVDILEQGFTWTTDSNCSVTHHGRVSTVSQTVVLCVILHACHPNCQGAPHCCVLCFRGDVDVVLILK